MLPRITGEAVVVMDPEVKFLDNGKTMVRLRVAAKTRKELVTAGPMATALLQHRGLVPVLGQFH